jgi:hypothetical protein
MLFKSHREKKKCSECASAVDWLSWFIETISNRKDLTIAEKKNTIKGIVPTARPNITQSVCMEHGIWMENFGKTHDACKYFLPKSAGLDYHQMRQVEERRLRREQMKIQNRTNYAMVFLTLGLVITAIVQILVHAGHF